jgi:predicted nucleotidyltransferase
MLLLENKDFREFIALLNSNAVRFLIVGGHAVTFHGCPRFTADLDLWVATDAKNALRVNQALKEFGFGNLFGADDFSRPGYAIQLGRPPYRIDILTSIQGVDFAPAYARRKILKVDGLELPFIGLNELLVNKRAVGRLHDLDDAAKLAAGFRRKANGPKPARAMKPKKRNRRR